MHFAIGDVHGCADELRLLLNKLPVTSDSTVVFLGDYVDRGPNSREVIETVLELSQQCQVVPLMGNHESMFLDFLDDPEGARAGAFIYNGGSATLASYANARGEIHIPDSHVRFLRELRLSYESDHYFFVHAGVPRIPLKQLNPKRHRAAMLWMRGRFLTTAYEWKKVIVHGHTPVEQPTILSNRINIDTGCVFRHRLTGIALPGERLFSVPHQTTHKRVLLRDASSRREAIRFRGTIPVSVERAGNIYDFVTVDYSEVGMYLRPAPGAVEVRLHAGERIRGRVGADKQSQVAFVGVIVRQHHDSTGSHYGVRIIDSKPLAADSGAVDPAAPHPTTAVGSGPVTLPERDSTANRDS